MDVTLIIWSVRFWTHPRFHQCPRYLDVSERHNQNWMSYADDKHKQRIFSIQGDVTLRLMICSGHVLNSSKISSISPLSGRFRKIWSKMNKLWWWQSQTEAFSAIKGYNSKINHPLWPVFKLVRDFILVHLSCKFQEVPMKTEQVLVMTKSNEVFFSNQGNVTKINDPIWPDFTLVSSISM